MIRLAILEDHPAIAEGLTALMKGEPDVTVVGTARDSVAAERLIQSQSPDVILCDIRLAGTVDGLEILARHTPGPAFIMLSAYSYPSYYSAAVERGAKGFLSKMAAIDEILTAVRKVAAGGPPSRTPSVARPVPHCDRRRRVKPRSWRSSPRAGPTPRSPSF